ncbi:DUF3592 domain-containing protein [Candidatus Saccharibacteria bacterium TM7i]|nr:DUF3592 domain-containing protein [Candidatus Saccharibacteria bacterium TM7i]
MEQQSPVQQPNVTRKKRLTKQQAVTLIICGVVVAIIGVFVAIGRMQDSALLKSGQSATGTPTGSYLQVREGGRRSKQTGYKAQYEFQVNGRAYFVHGEKRFESSEEAAQQRTVTVKYQANDPTKAIVESGE